MREVLVAVFDTVRHTDQAIQALEKAGVPASSVRRYNKDDPSAPHLSASSTTATSTAIHKEDEASRSYRSHGGFWSWLLGEEGGTADSMYERNHGYYERAIESGSTVIAVTVEQWDSDRVMKLLADQEPVQLEDTGTADATQSGSTTSGTATAVPPKQAESRTGEQEEVVPLAEEQVEVGKRRIDHTTKVRRYVVERPVERQLNLRDEQVEIERRRPAGGTSPGGGAFEERTVEVHTTSEQPEVNKTARVAEEVVVRKTATERPETVRETERKEQVEVEKEPPRGSSAA